MRLSESLAELPTLDEVREERARRSLDAFARRMLGLEPARHHLFVNEKLEAQSTSAPEPPPIAYGDIGSRRPGLHGNNRFRPGKRPTVRGVPNGRKGRLTHQRHAGGRGRSDLGCLAARHLGPGACEKRWPPARRPFDAGRSRPGPAWEAPRVADRSGARSRDFVRKWFRPESTIMPGSHALKSSLKDR